MRPDAPNRSTSTGGAAPGGASDGHVQSVTTLTTRATQAIDVVARDEADSPALRVEMRRAIADLTHALRRAGQPPEKVVITVKTLTRGVLQTVDQRDDSSRARQLLDDAVTTCVQAYYPSTPRAD